MLKTGSIWLVAMLYSPTDPLFSFGAGIYGIIFAGVVALLLLRDRVWKNELDSV